MFHNYDSPKSLVYYDRNKSTKSKIIQKIKNILNEKNNLDIPKHLDHEDDSGSFKNILQKILFIEQNKDKLIRKEIKKAEVLINCHIIILKDFIRGAKKLKWIHFGGAGVEKILIDELIKSNIIFINGKIIQGPELADHTVSLILYLPEILDRL